MPRSTTTYAVCDRPRNISHQEYAASRVPVYPSKLSLVTDTQAPLFGGLAVHQRRLRDTEGGTEARTHTLREVSSISEAAEQ
jgi:hypothetical protein